MGNKILAISPHPDDEAIGCGGAIIQHIQDGDYVQVIFLTSGEQGGHGKSMHDTRMIREEEAKIAAQVLQISSLEFWREPDGKLEPTDQNIARLSEIIETMTPDIIYVPHEQEEHPDHRAAALIVRQSIMDMKNLTRKPIVWMYEIWTPLQNMDHIIDISLNVEVKKNAILAYKSQCDVLQFDQAILGLNRYRGEMHSWPGGNYAEVFRRMKI